MDEKSGRILGLTRVQLSIVVILLVIVLGLFAVFAVRVRDAAERHLYCQNNLKRMALAIRTYADTYSGQLPPLYSAPVVQGQACPQSFFFTLLPFLEEERLHKEGTQQASTPGLTWTGQTSNGPLYSCGFVRAFVCPADPTNAPDRPTAFGWVGCSYGANYQVFGFGDWKPLFNIGNIPDGTANTIFLSERFARLTGAPGQFTDPDGRTQQANTLWAWPANHGTSPPTGYKTPVPQHAAMIAYYNDRNEQGFGPEALDLPQCGADPLQADYRRVQSGHVEVVYVGMGDGSARAFAADVSQITWADALRPADGFGSSGW